MFTINNDKLNQVTALYTKLTGKNVTADELENDICADWNEGEEHQEWLDEADADEIASWLKSFRN